RIIAMRPFHGSRYQGDDVAEAVKKMADPEIIYINSDGWLDEKDYADGVHPNVAGSQKAAARLTEFLQPYLTRWRRKTQKWIQPGTGTNGCKSWICGASLIVLQIG